MAQDRPTSEIAKRAEDVLAVLRTETALSRFPLHRLSRGKAAPIEIKNQASAIFWKLSHNADYGQPGALAYKLDSLFINRRIEEAGRPVPKTIRLGSLREIAGELGLGSNTNAVKEGLLQNATASITAKINYRTQDGGEQRLEAVFSRYSVVFTGEKLPQGTQADAVYLVLNDIYQQILSTAVYRPLDYDYMKSLPPSAQRFYEIVSYQIYAAVHHGNPRAKLLYSDYCLLSTATRYFDFDPVKKQMYKVLRPHVQSGYLVRVQYEAHTNAQGDKDWWMYFTPGPGAAREYRAFTGKGQIRRPARIHKQEGNREALFQPAPMAIASVPAVQRAGKPLVNITSPREAGPTTNDSTSALVECLVAAELNRGDAERFARDKPEECRRQLQFLPHVPKFTTSRGAYLRRAIEEGYGPPKGFAQEQARAQSAQAARRQRSEDVNQKTRQSHEKRFSEAFACFLGEWVGQWKKTQPEAAAAFQGVEETQRQALHQNPLAQGALGRKALATFERPAVQADRILEFCHQQGHRFGLQPLTFWEWDAAYNPQRFAPDSHQSSDQGQD